MFHDRSGKSVVHDKLTSHTLCTGITVEVVHVP